LLSQYIEIQKENLRKKKRIANLQQKIKKLKADAKAKVAKELAEKERDAIAAESQRRAA
jgi:flagellar motility protein MotE (MotC chaperone)